MISGDYNIDYNVDFSLIRMLMIVQIIVQEDIDYSTIRIEIVIDRGCGYDYSSECIGQGLV